METKERLERVWDDLCGLFVVIVDEKVYLLRQTTKRFLVRDKNSTVDTKTSQITGWKYILLPEESHRILADICASWISLMTLDRKGIKKGEFGSSRYWVMHFRQAFMQDGNPLITPRNVALPSKFRVRPAWSKFYTASWIASGLGLLVWWSFFLPQKRWTLTSKIQMARHHCWWQQGVAMSEWWSFFREANTCLYTVVVSFICWPLILSDIQLSPIPNPWVYLVASETRLSGLLSWICSMWP